jgi:glucose-1-phosphate cytidylyltransferase
VAHHEDLRHHGINDFVICCGYKGYVIKEYFANYFLHMSDVTFRHGREPDGGAPAARGAWNVTLVDTGDASMTGGRLLRVKEHVADEDAFCMTYGDGVGDVDIAATIDFHRAHGKQATLTAAVPPGRFGALDMERRAVGSSSKSRKATAARSTPASSCCRPRCSIASRTT